MFRLLDPNYPLYLLYCVSPVIAGLSCIAVAAYAELFCVVGFSCTWKIGDIHFRTALLIRYSLDFEVPERRELDVTKI